MSTEVAPRTVIVELRDLQVPDLLDQQHEMTRPEKVRRFASEYRYWLLFVVLPAMVAAFYFTFIAADIYVSEAKYIVRMPADKSAAGQLGGLVQSMSTTNASDDTQAINTFFISRDAMRYLRENAGLDAVYASPKADFLSRYPLPFSSRLDELQYRYYRSMLKVTQDKNTGISALQVLAFDPVDAQNVALALLRSGEGLANRLTERMREDMVRRAEEDLHQSQRRLALAQEAITAWRTREGQVDPTQFSSAIIESIAKLGLEVARMKAQENEIRSGSPLNPTLSSLRVKIAALEQQITEEKQSLAGRAESLAPRITEFETLQLERQLAEKILTGNVTSKQLAESDARRQQIYLERIVEPQKPDYPSYPYRIITVAVIFVVLQLVYLIISRLAANVMRHGDFERYFSRKRMKAV